MKNPAKAKAAKQFAQAWKGRGYEKGDAQIFWAELLRDVLGIERASTFVKFEDRTSEGGFMDGLIEESGVIIEQKSLGVDLDKQEMRQGRMVTPFEQAQAYAESFPANAQPRFIVVSDFGTFRVHDRNAAPRNEQAQTYIEFTLDELGEDPTLLDFIVDPAKARAKKEKRISIQGGKLIGELYDMLREQYINPDASESAHSLNVLCVRLVFCLFCEDAGLFPKDAFLNYLRNTPAEGFRLALKRLFAALNTPKEKRDAYDTDLAPFPYVNGGLFADDVEIPNFTQDIKHMLLFDASQETNWSHISPTIFGGIFESTLNPETRRSGGMHYTSPENIHKVIDPLFLNGLREDFDAIMVDEELTERKKLNRLRKLHDKICDLRFFDPACGSGNFLTETYLSLRKLEDDILCILNKGQTEIVYDFENSKDGEAGRNETKRVTLSQFYGIEVNDFAVRVAKTALWIAQLQANNESEMLLDLEIGDFPLTDSPNIIEGNALQMDWADVVPRDECNYIMGNPPFIGHQWRSPEQQRDMDTVFEGISGYGKLDYVCAWYILAARYIGDLDIHAAFVSTNSICQGESVRILWEPMIELGMEIDFAYPTFVWGNEANDQAHVHVVIVGFSSVKHPLPIKYLFYSDAIVEAAHINGYLFDAGDVFIANRGKPVNKGVPEMTKGSQPTDGGNLILSEEGANELLAKYPNLEAVIRPYMGGREFINGQKRYCLWFDGARLADYNYPEIRERLEAVREARKTSPTKSVQEAANTPALFTQIRQPKSAYLALPVVSSERRRYIPVGFVGQNVIASDQLRFIPTDDMYIFGLLLSKAHMAWLRVVAGRLKSDYRYSPAVYNSFVFPEASEQQQAQIAQLAQKVLDARGLYPEATLADLYDPDNELFYPELIEAHKHLDAAVEDAYGVDFGGDEQRMVDHLFKLYAEATKEAK